MRRWKSLHGSARSYAYLCIKHEWDEDHDANPIVRETMAPFLAAAREATQDQRQEFMELYMQRYAAATGSAVPN
jgi:hypothetical protein